MKKILLGTIALLFCVSSYAQTVIQMEEYGGVYRIPCKVNGAKMKLIFDTGADKVYISLTMAEYLLDNDYISTSDIKGSGSTTVADGSIVNHVTINIKDIEIQGIHLKNVEAAVMDGQNAPLLLGQSAIRRLGKYSISGNKLIIGTSNETYSQLEEAIPLTDEVVDKLFEEAANAYSNRAYRVALEIYKQLYEYDLLSPIGIMSYADCYYYTEQYEDAWELYQAIKNEVESKYPEDKIELYYQIGRCLANLGDYNSALIHLEKTKYYSEAYSYYNVHSVTMMMWCYIFPNDYYRAQEVLDDYISQYLLDNGHAPTDCWTESLRDDTLAELYYDRSIASSESEERDKYKIIAAAWGSKRLLNGAENGA